MSRDQTPGVQSYNTAADSGKTTAAFAAAGNPARVFDWRGAHKNRGDLPEFTNTPSGNPAFGTPEPDDDSETGPWND